MTALSRFDLSGRTAVVTGGSRGLGYTFARALAQAGAKVLIAARNGAHLEAAVKRLRDEHGLTVSSRTVDLGDPAGTETFAREVLSVLGRVDILVGNAGVEHQTRADGTTADDVSSIFTTNTTANMLLTSVFAPAMRENGWGRIIYLSSVVASIASNDGHGVYSASKGALESYARVAAVELGQFGITVNCIAPGVFLTDLPMARFDSMPADLAKQVYDLYANMSAVGRWGDPVELEGPLLLLASDAGSYITGMTLHIDGGLSIRMHSG